MIATFLPPKKKFVSRGEGDRLSASAPPLWPFWESFSFCPAFLLGGKKAFPAVLPGSPPSPKKPTNTKGGRKSLHTPTIPFLQWINSLRSGWEGDLDFPSLTSIQSHSEESPSIAID